jgi:hypothetical protein
VEKEYYPTSTHHILSELERIDMLIRTYAARSRQIQTVDGELQGLYISEQEANALLQRSVGLPLWATAPAPLAVAEIRASHDRLAADIAQRRAESEKRGITLRLDNLARLFGLETFQVDILLVCLAAEFDLRYERLYAYLQDDVTKKRPSVDLVLNLLLPSVENKFSARQHFAAGAPLLKNMILSLFDDPAHHQPTLLSKFLKVDDRVVSYLFGSNDIDSRLLPYVTKKTPTCKIKDLCLPKEMKHRLTRLEEKRKAYSQGMIFYFQGPYGSGKQCTAEALCHESEMVLLNIDGHGLLKAQHLPFETAVQLIIREALLNEAALYLKGFDALLADDKQQHLEVLLHELQKQKVLTFLAGETTWLGAG